MDFINFIFRAGNYPNIPLEKTMELWNSIAILLIAMIEENDPESLVIASVSIFLWKFSNFKDIFDESCFLFFRKSEKHLTKKAFTELCTSRIDYTQ